ncbi:PEP-CTERM sorting domain-containing protein [Ideonella sp. BN130291]|uniref:PEP-CTERM sorting domain-containing protein n=1 Tax=Ideonella sp. BN130291 TaxID=3112940 RepID=UPI002E26AC2B|nr:PEP-CTERM sorting domain-containing protein [Ideonella sp. BN130291]
MGFIKSSAAAAVAALAVALPAHAGLTGDTVVTKYVGQFGSSESVAVVGAGEDGNFFSNQFYDYSDTGFSIRSTSQFCGVFACSGEPVSLQLTSLDLGAPIGSVTFTTNLVGVTETHTADSITFSWGEQSLPTGTYLSAQINPVPEPQTYALMVLGLAAVGAAARRRAR